jgi:menaquinol-cytochrome c reductase iron-sulfur subunit
MQEDYQPMIPDQFDTTRRKFLKIITGILGTLVGFLVGIPFVRSLLGSKFAGGKQAMIKVANIASLSPNQPTRLNFTVQEQDAYINETAVHSAWVIVHSPAEVTVFSPICPHAGCYYNWDAVTDHFECPCHGSVFSIDGKVLGGPAPRPLDTLPHAITDGELSVTWERFKSGTPEKIEI